MGYIVPTSLPAAEPITLAQAKNYLRIDAGDTSDDGHIIGLCSAAREYAERITGKALAQRTWRQVLDSFPYYTDTIQSQLAYPPSFYSLPRYSSTLWNYSQMIVLSYPPAISVQQIRFINTDGKADVLNQDADFVLDRITQPARIFPIPGRYWPPNEYTPNACEIDFTAGYLPNPIADPDTHGVGVPAWSNTLQYASGDTASYSSQTWQANEEVPAGATPGTNDGEGNPYWSVIPTPAPGQQPDSIIMPGIPHNLIRIMFAMINFWYDHRDAALDLRIEEQLYGEMVPDFQPTRG